MGKYYLDYFNKNPEIGLLRCNNIYFTKSCWFTLVCRQYSIDKAARNTEICSGMRMNHKSFRINEKWVNSWRGCFIPSWTRQMSRGFTRHKQSVTHKNGRQLFTIFGGSTLRFDRSASCGRQGVGERSFLGLRRNR